MACALPREFQPGERFSYSNTGYLLLGAIASRVGGRHYSEQLRDRVFKPLGMPSARLIDEAAIIPHRAAGYRILDGKLANAQWIAPEQNTTGDGSLYLSLDDMIAWAQGLRAGKVLKPESWRQVYTPVMLNSGHSYPYGFGWDVYTLQRPGRARARRCGLRLQDPHHALSRRRPRRHRPDQSRAGRPRADRASRGRHRARRPARAAAAADCRSRARSRRPRCACSCSAPRAAT